MTDPYTFERYSLILKTGLENGWRYVSFNDSVNSNNAEKKRCLLRHDCDNDLIAALEMANIEASLGVHSTYFLMLRSSQYNLLAPNCLKIAQEIISLGHWLGIHFDEKGYEELTNGQLSGQVDREVSILEQLLSADVCAVSFHQPSRRILEGNIALSRPNTYSDEFFRNVEYRSDSNMRLLNEPCLSELLRDTEAFTLQLLTHPEWWTRDRIDIRAKWQRMLENNFRLMEQSLYDREDAYSKRHKITIAPLFE